MAFRMVLSFIMLTKTVINSEKLGIKSLNNFNFYNFRSCIWYIPKHIINLIYNYIQRFTMYHVQDRKLKIWKSVLI